MPSVGYLKVNLVILFANKQLLAYRTKPDESATQNAIN